MRAIGLLGINIGHFPVTKLTGGIYTCNSSGYNNVVSDTPSLRQGGGALFWRGKFYKVEETKNMGSQYTDF